MLVVLLPVMLIVDTARLWTLGTTVTFPTMSGMSTA